MSKFHRIAIIGRYQDADLAHEIMSIIEFLQHQGCTVLVEEETAHHTHITTVPSISYEQIGTTTDLVVVMGGDGTMLGASRKLAAFQVPLLGINHGNLGFMTDIPDTHAKQALQRILAGDFEIESRTMLQSSVYRQQSLLTSDVALNDVVLNRSGRSGMIEISVSLNGQFMYRQKADGVIVATPTGSTAYSVSANGPILHPQTPAFLIVPVAPQTLSSRPMAISDEDELELTLAEIGRRPCAASVQFDMQTWSDLQVGDRIVIRKSPHQVQFIHPGKFDFFAVLRRKLQWNTLLEQA